VLGDFFILNTKKAMDFMAFCVCCCGNDAVASVPKLLVAVCQEHKSEDGVKCK